MCDFGGGDEDGDVECDPSASPSAGSVLDLADGDPAIVGRLALTDSCSLLARLCRVWPRVGVPDSLDEMEEVELDDVRESTRRAVDEGRAEICIGGRTTGFGSPSSAALIVCGITVKISD